MNTPQPSTAAQSTTQPTGGFTQFVAGPGAGTVQLLGLNRGVPYQFANQNQNDDTAAWTVTSGLLPNVNASSGTAQTYKALVTGVGNSNYLQVVGLGTNGLPYLPCYQDSSGNWNAGQALPNVGSQTYSQLVTGTGNSNYLQVVGLGSNGLPYLSCWQDNTGAWHTGGALPNVAAAPPYTALVTGVGNSNYLQVVALGADGNPYLPSYLDNNGKWHTGGVLPNVAAAPPYTALVTGVGNLNYLQVVALGIDGNPYLPCFLQSNGQWLSGQVLPNVDAAPPYTALVTGVGNSNYLQVVGLGTDGLPYLPCYQDSDGVWGSGVALPNVSMNGTPQTYKALFTSPGANNSLLVLGLGTDGNAYLVCWQDDEGVWYPGMPFNSLTSNTPTTWIGIGPNAFVPTPVTVRFGGAVALTLVLGRGTTTIQATDNFFEAGTSFTVSPGQVLCENISSSFNLLSAEVWIPSTTGGPSTSDTMTGSINVTTTPELPPT